MLAAILASSFLALHPGTPSARAIRIPIEEPLPAPPAAVSRAPVPTLPTLSPIANFRVNDPGQFTGPRADITPSIAVHGDQVLVVWRVIGSLATQRLRAAWSVDGGATFTDAGWLPNIGTWRWIVDPCVEVDPDDGTFLIAAQVVDPSVPGSAIGILTAQIGGGLLWGPGSVTNVTGFIGALIADQLHSDFDTGSRRWHLAFHDGYVTPKALIHRSSMDHGASWSPPDTIVSEATGLLGLSPRITTLYEQPMVLYSDEPTGSFWDPEAVRATAFSWPAFPPATTLSTHRLEASSCPGTIGDYLSTPSLAVDRTSHLHASRAYAAWIQSTTLSWPAPAPVSLPESEPDDTPATATALGTATGYLEGAMSSNADVDVFSVDLVQGQHLVLSPTWFQSLGSNANCRTEIIGADMTHALGFCGFLPGDLGVGRTLFTAPRTGTFFIRVTGFDVGFYSFSLATSNETPSPVRDRRELMTSFSADDGASWWPVPIPLADPGFDAMLASLVVANDGRPYLFWLDFSRMDPDGGVATLEVTRSNDGGMTWETPRTISSSPSDWHSVTAFAGSNLKLGYRMDTATTPASDDLHVTWVDARNGEGDIYAAHFSTAFDVLFATTDTTAVPGQSVDLRVVVRNRNPVFADLVEPNITAFQRNWSLSYLAPFTVGEQATIVTHPFTVHVPDTATAGAVFFQGVLQVGSQVIQCNTVIHVESNVSVDPERRVPLAFDAPSPSPARERTEFRFTLPATSDVSLEVFDVTGARVRTLASGAFPAGAHARPWDLRDDGGRNVAPGVYLSRLTVGAWSRMQRLLVVR